MSNKAFTKTLLDSIHAVLKPRGFRKKGATFIKPMGGDVALLVNLQKSTSSDSASVRATVNLGVFSYAVSRACEGTGIWALVPTTPSVWDCHWQERLGHLMPEMKDRWWEARSPAEAMQTGEEIAAALTTYGLPALDQVDSTDRLRALWESGRSSGLTEKQRQEYLAALATIVPRLNADGSVTLYVSTREPHPLSPRGPDELMVLRRIRDGAAIAVAPRAPGLALLVGVRDVQRRTRLPRRDEGRP